MRAVRRVVILESSTVQRDLSYPASIAARGDFPARSSSLILSNMTIFQSTAIPIERTSPAMPGSVSVTPNEERNPRIKSILRASAIFATTP